MNLDYYNISETTLPLVPLRGMTIFPYMVIHFDVGRNISIEAVENATLNGGKIFLVSQKNAEIEVPQKDDIYTWGTVAIIKQMLKLPQGGIRILVEGISRAEIIEYENFEPFFSAKIRVYDYLENTFQNSPEWEARNRILKNDMEEYINLNQKISDRNFIALTEEDDTGRLIDQIAGICFFSEEDNYKILSTLDIKTRMEFVHKILLKELDILRLEERISVRVRNQMNQSQKEYYLREQIKAIRKELGEDEEIHAEIEELREKIEKKDLPLEVAEKAMHELKRLSQNVYNHAEAGVIRTYIDWILDLPWRESKNDNLDISAAKTILDRDHYGLKDVKERIIEYLAVKKMNPKSKGSILLFVGPPGVGKTSIAKSIAEALGRDFVRMSLGGVRDESEIRGHRRTYVGALPGRIISSMKKAGTNNPVILLDEIDKLASDFRGDPSSALLEVLDPEQNKDFRDHYLDLPFDLSNVLFITTANSFNIPAALLDRMEVIRISGYTTNEKLNIARKYLLKKQLLNAGVSSDKFTITNGAITDIIEHYTREAGVRNLERNLANIIRKSVVKILSEEVNKVSIKKDNLEEFLGPYKFTFDLTEKKDKIGVTNGLAWTSVGGETLQVEAITLPGTGKVQLTGKLGDVMKESAFAALSYIKSNAENWNIDINQLNKLDIHIHVPEGAVPKDGPSAGITMATSIMSSIIKKPVNKFIAMTGEITLTGRVLAIGGVKEKLLAAKRMGIKKVLLPDENKKDIKEIDQDLIKNMDIVYVKTVTEVFKIAIKNF